MVRDQNCQICPDIVSHHKIENMDHELGLLQFFQAVREKVIEFLNEHRGHKAEFGTLCELVKKDGTTDGKFFCSDQHVVLASTNLNNLYDAAILEMDHQFDTYMCNERAIRL